MKIYRVILLILLFIRAIGIGYAINYDKKIYHLEENEKYYYVGCPVLRPNFKSLF